MKLEDQVCSLELAKRLDELGVKQDGYFHWSYWMSHSPAENTDCMKKHWEVTDRTSGNIGESYSAFTVAELGEMLPSGCCMEKTSLYPGQKTEWWGWYPPEWHPEEKKALGDTEADARARMLIHLIENNLMEVK